MTADDPGVVTLKRRRRRSEYVPLPEVDRRIRARTPDSARLFTPGTADEVRFDNVAPIAGDSPWSAIALMSPNRPGQHAGLVLQQSGGARAIAIGMQDGRVAVEAGSQSRHSKLVPPLNQWSYVGVACDGSGSRVYAGTGTDLAVEDLPGLVATRCAADASVVIGKGAEIFSGAIAVICLFSDKLSDEMMRSIVVGRIDPLFAPKLCFGWIAASANPIDMVSRRAPAIRGTRIIPFGAAGRAVVYGPAWEYRVQVQPEEKTAAQPAAARSTAAAPAEAGQSGLRNIPLVLTSDPKPEPSIPENSSAAPSLQVIPDITDRVAATKSVLFRELGLVDKPEEKR